MLLVLVALGHIPQLADDLMRGSARNVHFALAACNWLAALMATAASAWILTRPEPQTISASIAFAARNLPRLMVVQLGVTAVTAGPGYAFDYLFGKHAHNIVTIIVSLFVIPILFVFQIAFISAAVEGGSPWRAIGRAGRRLRDQDVSFTIGGAFVIAIVAGIPAIVLILIAGALVPTQRSLVFGILFLPVAAYVNAWLTGANQELRRRSGEPDPEPAI